MPLELLAAPDAPERKAASLDFDVGTNGDSAAGEAPFGRPLRVMFMLTDMRVGGAEVLTANIIRRLNRMRFTPELCCLKERGSFGETLVEEIPVHANLLAGKYDLQVWPRLVRLLHRRKIDAVITVGAGDKMFWGRMAARRVGVPVVISALHSTGWPDGIGRLNRLLTPITDAFIAVAPAHGRFLIEHERFPAGKVSVIPNGVDTVHYAPIADVSSIRDRLGINPTDPVVGIVAALRPEKNHELFLEMARRVSHQLPSARFLLIGDGPCRAALGQLAERLGLSPNVVFLGSRDDVPELLAAMNVFVLTSHIEANPVSILEAMSAGRPVVATNVGSVSEAVADNSTGFLVSAGDAASLTQRVLQLLRDPVLCRSMGAAARTAVVERWSIESMVGGYERLIESIYDRKSLVVSRKS
jgi:glycosyltransferase involved in cell wall biosynthesis